MGTVMAKQDKDSALNRDGLSNPARGIKPPESPEEAKMLDLQEISARVDRVNFDGVVRTKTPILQHTIKPLFEARNFEEMVKKAHEVRGKLQSLGIFKNVGIHIDTSNGPKSTANGYEVTFLVNELRRLSGGVTTQVSNNEGILVVSGFLPNVIGNAETIKGEYKCGSEKSNSMSLSFSKPFLMNFDPMGTASVFMNHSEWPMSGYKLKDTGLLLDFSLNQNVKTTHNFQYELDWRNMLPVNKYASFEVREDAGNKLKSSFRHIMTIDNRDNPIFPNLGSMFKTKWEFAGLGGNVNFLKGELSVQWNFPLGIKDAVFQIGANTGHTFMAQGDRYTVSDNFFLGGPLDVRGFDLRSLGPQRDGNFIGGMSYFATALHLYTPLPFRPGQGGFGDLFRTHFWINAGNCGNLLSAKDEDIELMRLSAGVGVALRLGQVARVEVNFCHPIRALDTDHKVDGLQCGVGLYFL